MKTTYLKEFIKFKNSKIAYIPIGTIEWHGNHLPIETDFMVACKLCELISKRIPGYILPPIYLGTDKHRKINGKKYIGMNRKLKKELQGSVYYLKPKLLLETFESLVNNLTNQGFSKIIIITGHAGSKQIEVLNQIKKDIKAAIIINPFEKISPTFDLKHANEYETSLFWACYPAERKKSLNIKMPTNDDYIKYAGYDPREKASIKLGSDMLQKIIKDSLNQIKKFL